MSELVGHHPIGSAVGFILIYIVSVALSIPGATLLTLIGGFLFGKWWGTLYVNVGATSGAMLAFLLSRYLLGETLQQKYDRQLKTMNHELEKNGVWYILSLRLLPVFPFFLINLVAGLTRISSRDFF
ncbi:MAG: TVP38/TMEM64 family protein [Desulfobacteraceae bacterium]|nr:TVP38/TMEM64 family protein [Desulfobacteraceae bacterium]